MSILSGSILKFRVAKINLTLIELLNTCFKTFEKPSNLNPKRSNSSLYDGAFFSLAEDLHSIIIAVSLFTAITSICFLSLGFLLKGNSRFSSIFSALNPSS